MNLKTRSIGPGLIEDAITAGLSDTAFRLFVGMILIADDYGNVQADPAFLASRIFWGSPPATPVRDALTELTRKLIFPFLDEGRPFLRIRCFKEHKSAGMRRVDGGAS